MPELLVTRPAVTGSKDEDEEGQAEENKQLLAPTGSVSKIMTLLPVKFATSLHNLSSDQQYNYITSGKICNIIMNIASVQINNIINYFSTHRPDLWAASM